MESKITKIHNLKNNLEVFLESDAYQQNKFYQDLPVSRLIPKFKKRMNCPVPNYLFEFVAQYIIGYRMDNDIFNKERENNILYADCILESVRSVLLKYSYKFLVSEKISEVSRKSNVYLVKENGNYYVEFIERGAKDNVLGLLISSEYLALTSDDNICLHTKDSYDYGMLQNKHFHLTTFIEKIERNREKYPHTNKEIGLMKQEKNNLKLKLQSLLVQNNYNNLVELCLATNCSSINISLKPNKVITKEIFDNMIEKLTTTLSNKSCHINIVPYNDIKKHFCSCCNEFIFLNGRDIQKCSCGVLINYDKNTVNNLSLIYN